MKKMKFFTMAVSGTLAIAGGLGLTACGGLGVEVKDKSSAEIQRKEYAAQTETGTLFLNLLDLTVKAVSDSVQKTAEYDNSVQTRMAARTAQSGAAVDLYDVLSAADLSKTKPGAERSAEGVAQTTLEDELNAIIAEYEKGVAAFTPDLSFLDGAGYAKVEGGLVFLDEDMVIDPSSMAGIIQLALIKAELAGEDVDAIIADMNQAAAAYGEKEDAARGVYKLGTRLWPSKTVCYAFGAVTEQSKKRFQEIMSEWSSKVPGLKFVDKTNDAAYKNAAASGQKPLVVLESPADLGDAGGVATVGALNGKSSCKVRSDQSSVVYRHELGHTLGLNHEHQRWDRDTYLSFNASMTNDTTNWGLIPWAVRHIVYGFYWDYFTINTFWGKVRIYYLAYGKTSETTTQISTGTSNLDYKSVMLYWYNKKNNLRAKVAKQGYKVGQEIDINHQISEGDVATVKYMYQ